VSDGGAASGSFSYSVESVSGENCGSTNCLMPPLQPIELGEAFEFSASASASAQSGGFAADFGVGDGAANATYSVEFFEANGVTPVGVSETPEPASAALAIVGLLWLLRRAIMPGNRLLL